jgi:hypothetical protein
MSAGERRLAARLSTPHAVQRWLRSLDYNWETDGRTMHTFRGVVRTGMAHCLEGALAAAAIMETHGHPPLLLDLESRDRLDHVVFAFRTRGRWGAVGVSRDVGLWGRRPVYRSTEALARSYYEPYIDLHARITGYAVFDLTTLTRCDWRLAAHNVWKVERVLRDLPHRPLRTSDRRYIRLREIYRRFVETHDPTDTPFRSGQRHWM